METPAGYRPLDAASLPPFLATLPAVAARLGGTPGDWKVSEVGDGNLNLVFIVRGPAGGVCVKQALPYVRLVGESWPMPLKRAYFEHQCLTEHGRQVGRLLPEIYHYEPPLYAIVMELLQPHIIMRRGMIQGIRYPRFAADIASYMAKSLYFTSDLALPAGDKKRKMAVFCDNTELCKITEDLIFTDPYMIHERNRWTKPQLDGIAAEFRGDSDLKLAISRLKLKFLSSAEALIHGDLHTGSIMITESDTRIIDPEFAFFGPMGFDVGAVLGNLLMSYFSQDGYATTESPRADYQDWVLATTEEVWTRFREQFLALWRDNAAGDAYPQALFADTASEARLEAERQAYMDRLFADTVGFAAAKTVRRILGLAHNIDFEWIKDADSRALCETRALRLARDMMVHTERYRDIGAVTAAARQVRREVTKLN
ncbi:MAG TPA: S-methyl-5-thioribose kinase [Verrucomicrobiae bacterium]|nr:S-methyl-5-thioribose kinase [Verrucomicrobiae bacterium]